MSIADMLLEHDPCILSIVREDEDVHPESVGGGGEVEGEADLYVSQEHLREEMERAQKQRENDGVEEGGGRRK
jgi:hypothetical protein